MTLLKTNKKIVKKLIKESVIPLSPLINFSGGTLATSLLLVWIDYYNSRLFPEWLSITLLIIITSLTMQWRKKINKSDKVAGRAALTFFVLPFWFSLIAITNLLGWISFSTTLTQLGIGMIFILGLGWSVWLVDRSSLILQLSRKTSSSPLASMNNLINSTNIKTSNPLDIEAWYYGTKQKKLNQSATTILLYTFAFILAVFLITNLTGCNEVYELPDGGGEPKLKQNVIKIQKVIRKKIIINPLSAVLFNPPPIEEIKLQLQELTKHIYEAGQGESKNTGFDGGTKRGKVRFIRLSYSGGDWEQDLNRNSDLNMLLWYAANTGHKTAKKPEVRSISQLKQFPTGKSPPLVYITGQENIRLSKKETEILQEYILDSHGMIFADNGGSSGWHSQFFSLMQKILPKVKPQPVPLDHPIHNGIPFLPVVAPHGGKVAWGWVVDGRIAVYYHPGDIGDAWADGHAGVPRHVWESGYRLGGNVMLYANSEYSRWLTAKKQSN